MSEVKVNKISPRSGTTVTLGDSGDTFTIPSGATINNQGTATNFGATGSASWTTTVKTNSDSGFTAVAGEGYFLDTSSGTISVNLPAGTAGAVVAFKDYAGTFDTNNVTLVQNGSDKIGGSAVNSVLNEEGIAVTLVFIDSTQGWLVTDSGLQSEASGPQYIAATGGTVTTVCTNFKVHTFTSPGTFCVSAVGNPAGSNTISYMVVAGGGGVDTSNPGAIGGGGAGGFREGKSSQDTYTASPLACTAGANAGLPVAVTAYPVTIGAGGTGGPTGCTGAATPGSNSVFSGTTLITSAGGGKGRGPSSTTNDGGSGGGGSTVPGPTQSPPQIGSGNTPPVTPPQGNPGAFGLLPTPGTYAGGGGGGATAAGTAASPSQGGDGGAGATTNINGSPTAFAGGGGGASGREPTAPSIPAGAGGAGGGGAGGARAAGTAGTANTGGGAGGTGYGPGYNSGAAGGSGIVVIRYKFQ